MKVTLYKKDVSGSIRVWSIERESENVILIRHGLLDGAMQDKAEYVEAGKAGRTLDEQIMSRMASRIGKQRDAGYVNSLEKAMTEKVTNTLKMPKPMLANKLEDVTLPDKYYLQYKYDGNRCLITKQNGKVFAYSRNGKLIHSIDHILEAARDIPEGTILDGELYCHGIPLQTLRSWISRKQAASQGLVYMCYDIIEEGGYETRVLSLEKLGLGYPITLAETRLIDRKAEVLEGVSSLLLDARKKGYEGLIARIPGIRYEDGKRSKSLVKIKMWIDAEYRVIGIESSADDWAILICDSPKGQFKVSAPGSIAEKSQVLQNQDHYIGRMVTIEYANLTNRGIPFQPVAIAWRDNFE